MGMGVGFGYYASCSRPGQEFFDDRIFYLLTQHPGAS